MTLNKWKAIGVLATLLGTGLTVFFGVGLAVAIFGPYHLGWGKPAGVFFLAVGSVLVIGGILLLRRPK